MGSGQGPGRDPARSAKKTQNYANCILCGNVIIGRRLGTGRLLPRRPDNVVDPAGETVP